MSAVKGLDIGKRAMMLQAEAVRTTGQNISNASLPGYSRQKIELRTTIYESGDKLTTMDTRRVRDEFIDKSIRSEYQELGEWEMRSRLYGQVEMVFLEPSDHGLNDTLAEFWNSWEDAASNPENLAPRAVVTQYGTLVAQSINRFDSELKDVREAADGYVKDRVMKLNNLADEIADINDQIMTMEASTAQEASEVRDRRDHLIDQMAKIVDTRVVEREESISVLVGGRAIVDGVKAIGLDVQRLSSDDMTISGVVWESDGTPLNISGGELAGLIDTRDEVVPGILTKIDDLTTALIAEVNALHSAGYGSNGSTGLDFFSGTNSSDIAVNSQIIMNANNVAISGSGELGDTTIARSIAELSEQNIAPGNMKLGDYYSDIVDAMGTQSHGVSMMMENSEMLLNNLDEQRESVSGVSLDEEAANLIRFQSAYESAARFISVVDEMVSTLLDIV